MVWSNKNKVEIIFFYGEANQSYNKASRFFSKYFLDRPVSPSYVRNVVIKFSRTFSVKDASRSGRPSVKTKELQVLSTVAVQLTKSVCTIALL